MHNPEHWGYLLFRSREDLSSKTVEWHDPVSDSQKRVWELNRGTCDWTGIMV